MSNAKFLAVVLALACMAGAAHAHKPLAVGALDTSPAQPLQLLDIAVSQVVYYIPTANRPEVWTRFHAEAGQQATIQLGIPRIPGKEGVRPAFAVLGPGLPAVDLPFDAPEEIGGVIFTSDGDTPQAFDEPFTGTKDYQFAAHTITLPQSGDYYLVGYLPSGALDKFWLVLGEEETFSLSDYLSLPAITYQVRQYHEVFPIGGLALLAPLGILAGLLLALIARFAA